MSSGERAIPRSFRDLRESVSAEGISSNHGCSGMGRFGSARARFAPSRNAGVAPGCWRSTSGWPSSGHRLSHAQLSTAAWSRSASVGRGRWSRRMRRFLCGAQGRVGRPGGGHRCCALRVPCRRAAPVARLASGALLRRHPRSRLRRTGAQREVVGAGRLGAVMTPEVAESRHRARAAAVVGSTTMSPPPTTAQARGLALAQAARGTHAEASAAASDSTRSLPNFPLWAMPAEEPPAPSAISPERHPWLWCKGCALWREVSMADYQAYRHLPRFVCASIGLQCRKKWRPPLVGQAGARLGLIAELVFLLLAHPWMEHLSQLGPNNDRFRARLDPDHPPSGQFLSPIRPCGMNPAQFWRISGPHKEELVRIRQELA